MKKITIYAVMLLALVLIPACGGKQESHKEETHSSQGHDHESHDHDHDAHDHDHDDHKHEGECKGDHNHDHAEGEDHSDHSGHDHDVKSEGGEESNIIALTEDQIKNILEFKVETIKKQTFNQILKTSGQILSAPGDESLISATMSGIITISNSNLVEGFQVSRGQQLFSISGKTLSENNSTARVNEAKVVFENAKAEFERAQELVKENIISQKDFLQTKLSYEQAQLNYQTYASGMSANGKSILSPMSGYIKNLSVQSGQYVEMGQTLANVTQNQRLILRADVSQRYLHLVRNVKTATFTTPYDNKTYELSDLNGKFISIGRNSGENSYYTPVNFEFDNKGNVVEGSFVEVYLKSLPVNDALVLPITALTEEQGRYFVFVELDHKNEFVKREVKIGASDGISRQILGGLKDGEKVVVKGSYAVKLASMSNAMPAHSHDH